MIDRAIMPWLLCAVVAAATLPATESRAHSRPSKHTAVIQVEDSSVVLYVAWTPPSGLVAPLILARASVLVPENIREGLGRLMAQAALRALEVRIDGTPVEFSRMQKRLLLDMEQRYTVAILAEASLGSEAKAITVRSRNPKIQLAWSNRQARRIEKSTVAPAVWTRTVLEIGLSTISGGVTTSQADAVASKPISR